MRRTSRTDGNWRPGWDWCPRQHSTGGKQTLLGISKRGDSYLRTLLIHGARAVIRVAERKAEQADRWLKRLLGRRNKNVAAVALANKNARIVWALLAHDRDYQSGYVPVAAPARNRSLPTGIAQRHGFSRGDTPPIAQAIMT